MVKVCFQSRVNVRKYYLPYGFLLNCCCFLRLEKIFYKTLQTKKLIKNLFLLVILAGFEILLVTLMCNLI